MSRNLQTRNLRPHLHTEQQLNDHVDAISEEELTQGHPQSQLEDEQVVTNPMTRPVVPSRGGRANIAQSRQQQVPPNAVASSSARRRKHLGPNAPSKPTAPHRPNVQFNHGTAVASSSVPRQPMVSKETMIGANKATTSRLWDFMPFQ
ncbi:hypothetical protein PIB30_078919 [Stylosanthes scabra]|uniref:Uncharacterized protein n=1 Tax=Stylosanthes scabra TaxID=79078 RepID=A0ABU6TRN6_9FABA|nr:hypothetical protein [Stylosanthes scabra]